MPRVDKNPPEVYIPEPSGALQQSSGDTLPWRATLVDDRELHELAFGVVLEKDSLFVANLLWPEYSITTPYPLHGNTLFITDTVFWPDTMAGGTYLLTWTVTDEAGLSASTLRTATLKLATDPNPPTIAPIDVTDTLAPGDPQVVSTILRDSVSLAYAWVQVVRNDESRTIYQRMHPLQDTMQVLIDTIPLQQPVGRYTVRIIAVDKAHNRTTQTVLFSVF